MFIVVLVNLTSIATISARKKLKKFEKKKRYTKNKNEKKLSNALTDALNLNSGKDEVNHGGCLRN